MKKGRIGLSIIFLLLSGLNVYLFFKSAENLSAWQYFLPLKKKFDRFAMAATGFEPVYAGLTSGSGALLFKVPSITPDFSLITGSFDIASAVTTNDTLVFGLIPSVTSFRASTAYPYFSVTAPALNQAGDLAEFSCRSKNRLYSCSAAIMRNVTALPIGGEKLQ